jgi:hypothetical protein
VDPNCGCTVAEYTKTPIRPKEKGEVTVRFSSESKLGETHSSVKVYTNTYPNCTVLEIKSNIVKP